MMKKIMMDMKLNGKRTIETSVINKKDEITKPIILLPNITPTPEQTFSENESLRRASVFTSGWQSSNSIKNDIKNDTIDNNLYMSDPSNKRLRQTPQMKRKSNFIGRFIIKLFIISLFIGIGYWGLVFFEKTTIMIQEKNQIFKLDHELFTASKDIKSPLHFEIMIVSDTESKNIILTESENVSIKSKGNIVLYNEYSTKPQTILINSYLADENGKTYRIDNTVTIPGYKIENTKIIPGQVNASISAFLPGDAYNGSPKNFTLSGFKGTVKFKKIYGKALTPITGGAQGLFYILGATEKGSLNAIADSSFKNRLLKKINAEVPKGYILYPDAITFTYNIDDTIKSLTPDTKVNIDSTLSAVILKENDVKNVIIKNLLPTILPAERKEIDILDISKLRFNFIDSNQLITKDMQSVPFVFTGDVNAIWHPDLESLKLQVVGILKTNLPSVFKLDPGIIQANVKIFPPWQSYLPKNSSKIDILSK